VAPELGREAHHLAHRVDAAHDDAVDLAVGQRGLLRLEQLLHQEVAAQPGGVECAGVFAVDGLADVHGRFLCVPSGCQATASGSAGHPLPECGAWITRGVGTFPETPF
jgi:hypothetical protein